MRTAIEPDRGKRRMRRLDQRRVVQRRTPKAKTMPRLRLYGEHDIGECRELRKNRGDLERAGETLQCAAPRGLARDIAPAKHNHALIRRQLALDLRNERRLAGAVRSDQSMRF